MYGVKKEYLSAGNQSYGNFPCLIFNRDLKKKKHIKNPESFSEVSFLILVLILHPNILYIIARTLPSILNRLRMLSSYLKTPHSHNQPIKYESS